MRDLTPNAGSDLVRIVCNSFGVLAPPKTGLCEFHPPVSKGGILARTAKGVHLGDLRMHGRRVSSPHELIQDCLLQFWVHLVDNALYVLWAQP